jgi:hypothetical protein
LFKLSDIRILNNYVTKLFIKKTFRKMRLKISLKSWKWFTFQINE